ncbi:LysR family transcriptional regulator [Paracoccus sp. (in: a-proteobacteria)]|uniref:LysR family transcriptional regulator n=1 Tax=Paracoccus sp. TaxID=267 RepID=UPI00289A8E39|nr:LysR family transcriptional regulator [Paracoccus sp. (in: a-proteobacteria)]
MDWDKLRIFHAVADAGSLTHAGETLHLSQSAVSRQIRALEDSLGTTLFHRHARGLILTEQGELLFEATMAMVRKLDTTSARIRDSEEHVYGELKLTTTTGFGTLWLVPRLAKLYDRYPDLKIDLILEERVLDLPMREADVAIRMKEPNQQDLIRRRLLNIRMRLYATRDYLEKAGTPRRLEDLSKHRIICQDPQTPQVSSGAVLAKMLLSQNSPSTLLINSYFGVLQAVSSHVGIGILPDYVAADIPDLVRVLPDLESTEVPVFLAFPEELRTSRRVSAFRDFVLEEIQAMKKGQSEAESN